MRTFSEIAPLLEGQAIEVPSWAYGNSGTRFKLFGAPGTPRTVEEKVADAAAVHRFTGLAPSVALHIPWDLAADYAGLRGYAPVRACLASGYQEQIEADRTGGTQAGWN